MNNCRLLLLAVVVVVQPIGSFTESNLIDGRECCERSEDSRLYGYRKLEERRALDGNREDTRTNNERRLSLLDRNIDRRYETSRGPMLIRSERSLERSERRISPELSRYTEQHFTRDQARRHQEIREDQNSNRDESRNSMGKVERNSLKSRNRDILHVRLTTDARDTRSEQESRNFMSRLPIRSSRSLEERRVQPNTETTNKPERENIVRSATRRDTRLSTPVRYESRMQPEDNKERRAFDRRTREDTSRYRHSDARMDDEVRDVQAQLRSFEQKERNNRDSRVVSVELRTQLNTELGDRVRVVRHYSDRVSADNMRDSRDDARTFRQGEIRNEKITVDRRQQRDESRRSIDTEPERNTVARRLDSHQTRTAKSLDITRNDERMERSSLSMDRLSMLRASRDRLSRDSGRNARDERSDRNSDVSAHLDGRQETDRSNGRSYVRRFSEERGQPESRDKADRTQESRRDVSEQRQQRDSRISRDRISSLRDVQDSDRRQESRRDAREHSEERMLQRDDSRLLKDRTSDMLRMKGEVQDTVRAEELRRIVIDSRSRQDNRDNERSDLRRQVLERSIERVIRMTRSSEERRHDNRETSRRSRSAEALRIREETRSIEGGERRQTRNQDRTVEQRVNRNVATPQQLDTRRSSRTKIIRLERTVRNRDDVRETGTRNVDTSQRLETRMSLRTESIRLERLVRDRDDIRENEKRGNNRPSRIISDRRSSERMLTERRQVNQETAGVARDVRLIRNRDEVKSESTLAERMQENRGTARDSQHVRVTRTRSQVRVLAERRQENLESTRDSRNIRSRRVLAERRQENRESTRDSRNIRSRRVLAERRQENRESTRDSRNIRDDTRKLGEDRSQRVLAKREQNRDSGDITAEIQMDERFKSPRQRDVTKDSRERLLRETRDTERRAERSIEQEKTTRNVDREIRMVRNVRIADVRRESRNDMRANNIVMDIYRTSNRLAKDARNNPSRVQLFNDAVIFRDNMDKSNESVFNNWHMIFYTLQGAYLCGLLLQLLTENGNKTKKRTINWWTSPKNLIKLD